MLSFGVAAFDINKKIHSTFTKNINVLPGASQHPDNMKFWASFPREYEETRVNMVSPEQAMKELKAWLTNIKKLGKPVFCAWPTRFDLRFIDYYSWRFLNEGMLGLGAMDIKSFACATTRLPYYKTTKKFLPAHWYPDMEHTHVAIDDAIEQGMLFINILRENRGLENV